MESDKKIQAQETVSKAALEAALVVKEAVEQARKMVETATEVAADIVERENTQELKITRLVSEALREVFGEKEGTQRFIDVSRIPLICKSIFDMQDNIKEIKEGIKASSENYEKRIRLTEDTILLFKTSMEKTFEFMLQEKKEKVARNSFWGNVKQNWVNYLVVAMSMGIAGTFIPLIWKWLGHIWG